MGGARRKWRGETRLAEAWAAPCRDGCRAGVLFGPGWGRRARAGYERSSSTSTAALMPDSIAPSTYPIQRSAVSVPAQ